jgi:hypothetical protein
MKVGDLVRLRKSHPTVKIWRRHARRYGSPAIGRWAEEGTPLLLLEKRDYSDTRWEVLGPGGELASFDDYLMTTRGMVQ